MSKECQLDLFADRTSAATMRANQLHLWFASMAYVLLCALRRVGLAHKQFAQATCGTIRLKLLKLGALVRVSVRRIKVAMASACPFQHEFSLAHARPMRGSEIPQPDTNQTGQRRHTPPTTLPARRRCYSIAVCAFKRDHSRRAYARSSAQRRSKDRRPPAAVSTSVSGSWP